MNHAQTALVRIVLEGSNAPFKSFSTRSIKMYTQFDTVLSTITTADLHAVTGGSNDPGNDYVSTLKKDLLRTGKHEVNAVNAARNGNWIHAGGEAIRTAVDSLDTAKHAVKPLEPIWNLAKDILSVAKK
jgi:hypothetical protein